MRMYDNVTHKLLYQRPHKTAYKDEAEAEIIRKIAQADPGEVVEIPGDIRAEWRDELLRSTSKMTSEDWYYMMTSQNEIDPHAPGAKLDQDKIRAGLVLDGFKNALMAVSEVGTFGAKKYSDNGWLHVENGYDRYRDALFRHLLATDFHDPESGLPHLAHAAWNMLAMLELMHRELG